MSRELQYAAADLDAIRKSPHPPWLREVSGILGQSSITPGDILAPHDILCLIIAIMRMNSSENLANLGLLPSLKDLTPTAQSDFFGTNSHFPYHPDFYSLASGLYGPGSMLAYYFLHLSRMISRSTRSTPDFLAIIVYTLFAATDLLIQSLGALTKLPAGRKVAYSCFSDPGYLFNEWTIPIDIGPSSVTPELLSLAQSIVNVRGPIVVCFLFLAFNFWIGLSTLVFIESNDHKLTLHPDPISNSMAERGRKSTSQSVWSTVIGGLTAIYTIFSLLVFYIQLAAPNPILLTGLFQMSGVLAPWKVAVTSLVVRDLYMSFEGVFILIVAVEVLIRGLAVSLNIFRWVFERVVEILRDKSPINAGATIPRRRERSSSGGFKPKWLRSWMIRFLGRIADDSIDLDKVSIVNPWPDRKMNNIRFLGVSSIISFLGGVGYSSRAHSYVRYSRVGEILMIPDLGVQFVERDQIAALLLGVVPLGFSIVGAAKNAKAYANGGRG